MSGQVCDFTSHTLQPRMMDHNKVRQNSPSIRRLHLLLIVNFSLLLLPDDFLLF